MWFEILYLPLRLTETHNSGRNSALYGVCVTEDNILLRCASKTRAPEASPTLLRPSSSTRIGAAAVGGHQASRATLRASGPAFCQLTDAAMFRAVPSAIFLFAAIIFCSTVVRGAKDLLECRLGAETSPGTVGLAAS